MKTVLHAVHGSRLLSFRFDLLDETDTFLRDATSLVVTDQSEISMDNTATDIARSAKFTVKDDGSINFLKYRIRPWSRLLMPDGGYAEWPHGVFLLSTPARKYQGPNIYRDVQAYGKMQILHDAGFTARYVVDAGTNYVSAVIKVLTDAGIPANQINIQPTTLTLPTWLDWPPDTNRIEVVNTLLKIINYIPLFDDDNGMFVSYPYMTPQQRAEEYSYATDSWSVINPGATDTADYFSVPNQWVGVVSEPDRTYLTYTYTNDNANSLTSTVNRGRTITKYINVDAADLTSLQGIVQQQAFTDSQIARQVTFQTAVMPIHSYNDVFHLTHTKLGIDGKYQELSWTMPLKAGASMQHVVREVVSI